MDNYSKNQVQADFIKRLSEFTETNGNATPEQEAILYAQSVQKFRLKFPDTAEFGPIDHYTATPISNGYKVTGYSSGRNSYGNMAKDTFDMSVSKHDGEWTLYKNNEFSPFKATIGFFMIIISIAVILVTIMSR